MKGAKKFYSAAIIASANSYTAQLFIVVWHLPILKSEPLNSQEQMITRDILAKFFFLINIL